MADKDSTTMKKFFSSILILFALVSGLSQRAEAASGDLFIYPVAPDTMMALQPRCDYIVSRFWDRCNFGTAFTKPDKLNRAFGDWISIMPHATADTVHHAIDRLMARFVKKGPETLQLATNTLDRALSSFRQSRREQQKNQESRQSPFRGPR